MTTSWYLPVTDRRKFRDYPYVTGIGANLNDMAYRGDDAARDRAAWGAQSPRQSSGEQAGYDRPGYDAYGQGDGYHQGDTYGQHDGYGQPDGYGQHDGYGP